MANMMNIPVLGLVENLSYFTCPDNGKDYKVFGDSHIDDIAAAYRLPVLARLPIDPSIAESCDKGAIESLDFNWFDEAAEMLKKLS